MMISLDRGRPMGDQIYLYVREAVLGGEFKPGDRLPSSRDLARRLRVARNTVVAAYSRLQSEGYILGMRAKGTRVSADIPHTALKAGRHDRQAAGTPRKRTGRLTSFSRRVLLHPDIFPPSVRLDRSVYRWDFQYNVNVSDASSRRAWSRILRRVAARYEMEAPAYSLRHGPEPLQRTLARYLRLTRGVVARPEQVLVVGAYQRAIQLAARVLIEPGDVVVVEDPHALRVRHAFLAAGAKLIPGHSDDAGLCMDRLPSGRRRVRLLYTSPSCQWATGAVLPFSRRLQLLEWAREHDCWILENDHNSEHIDMGTPVESLQGLDRDGRVIYMGTFSRLISPDPLIGYMVVPESLTEVAGAARLVDGHHGSPLDEEVLTRFLESGEMESLLRRLSCRLRGLRGCLIDELRALPDAPFEVRDARAGLHVHARMPSVRTSEVDALVKRAGAAGIGVFTDLPYFLRKPPIPGLILGYAALSPRQIREAVHKLGEVVGRSLR